MRYPEQSVAIATRLIHTFSFHCWFAANLAYLAPPIDFLMGTKCLTGTHFMRNRCPKKSVIWAKRNLIVSMATHKYKLDFDSTRHSKLIISQPKLHID